MIVDFMSDRVLRAMDEEAPVRKRGNSEVLSAYSKNR